MALRAQLLVATALTGLAASAAAAQAQTSRTPRPGVVPPSTVRAVVVPSVENPTLTSRVVAPAGLRTTIANTVTLQRADPADAIRALPVERELGLNEIRATRTLKLGSSTLDLSAMLDDPKALPNVARNLAANPALVRVEATDTRAYIVPQGLVVRSFLNYRIKPGTCSSPGGRAAIARAGIACPEQQSEASRIAGYSNPSSLRFVANPGLRAKAISDARADWARQEAENAARLTTFRAILANPAERAKVAAEVGDGELGRLEALGDEQLTGELVGTAQTKIEDTMFVPRADKVDLMPAIQMKEQYRRDLLSKLDQNKVTNQPIDKVIFLTGFTLGRQYEWSKRIEKTIKWCLVGCAETYYAEGKAGFSYGFGLRFPIELSGNYKHESDSAGTRGWLTANFDPIDGSPEQYRAAGLAQSQVFRGQEFVAELTANAGYAYRLPIIGSDSWSKEFGWNLAEQLPHPYTNGHFKPPRAGHSEGEIPFTFTQIDLLMGYGNWGAAGIVVHPAVKVALTSKSLKFVVHDNIAGTDQEMVTGKRLPLAVDAVQKMSSFSIGAPVYNLGFTVTPGVNAKAFIDVGVWGDSWNFPIWFPQVAITLPPGGIDFACHSGTICRRDYFYTAESHTDLVGEAGAAMAGLLSWGSAFERDWVAACATAECRTAIAEVRRSAQGLIEDAIKVGDIGSVEPRKKIADNRAREIAYGSQNRVVTDAVAEAKPKCQDDKCPPNLDGIAATGIGEMDARRESRILSWSEARPTAVDNVNEWIRVELVNSGFRSVKVMRPDIPVITQPTADPGRVMMPIDLPPPPETVVQPVPVPPGVLVPILPPPPTEATPPQTVRLPRLKVPVIPPPPPQPEPQ